MTTPAPYNRDTLQGIREAARNEVSLEKYAAQLGWPVSQLRNVCQRNCIDMRSVPAPAPKHVGNGQGDALHEVGGLKFDVAARRAWDGTHSVVLADDTFDLLVILAEAGSHSRARSRIVEQLFGDLPWDTAMRRLDTAIEQLKHSAPHLGRQLVVMQGEHLLLARHSGEVP